VEVEMCGLLLGDKRQNVNSWDTKVSKVSKVSKIPYCDCARFVSFDLFERSVLGKLHVLITLTWRG
jgi:hypothetical protein